MKRTLLVLMILALAASPHFTSSPHARAASGPDCSWFDYQEDAQAMLDGLAFSREGLDPDRNGRACEELPKRPAQLAHAQLAIVQSPEFLTHGDRIDVCANGDCSSVALLGIETGDQSSSSNPVACMAHEVADHLKELLPQTDHVRVYLERESAISDSDDALLRDVWVVNGQDSQAQLLSQRMLEDGYAALTTAAKSSRYAGLLTRAASDGYANRQKIWQGCGGTGDPPGVLPPAVSSSSTATGSNTPRPSDQPNGLIFRVTGRGDTVSNRFAVHDDATYKLTVKAGIDTTFLAVDVFRGDGTWIPEFSIDTLNPGASSSSAGQLANGIYYVQVKSTGSWTVMLTRFQ